MDAWYWYAYDYGWRRVALNDFGTASPMDSTGEWLAADLALAAERYWRRKLDKPMQSRPAKALSDSDVRPDWRKIPSAYLTDAERHIAGPLIDRLSQQAREAIAKAETKWRDAFAPMPKRSSPAVEIAPHTLLDEEDPEVARIMAEMREGPIPEMIDEDA